MIGGGGGNGEGTFIGGQTCSGVARSGFELTLRAVDILSAG